jgi:hypothetical protein
MLPCLMDHALASSLTDDGPMQAELHMEAGFARGFIPPDSKAAGEPEY